MASANTGSSDASRDRGACPRVLFLALANDVGMERLPAAIAKLGAACAVVSPAGFYCTTSRFIDRSFNLPQHYGLWLGVPFARSRLEAAVHAWQPDLLVPLDNVAALFMQNIVTSPRLTERLRDLIKISLGSPIGYAAACSRAKLMDAASALSIRLPRYHTVYDKAVALQVVTQWGYPVVLKAEFTCGGHGVVIVSNPDELEAALKPSLGFVSLWQRARTAGRHWIWKLAGIRGTRDMQPVLQAFIPGIPAMRTVSAWNGQVLDGVSFIAERVNPAPTGASSVVRYIQHAEMADTARRVVKELGCSGFVSFDFILDTVHKGAYLIEMNPRPISTTHLGRLFGHDVAAALLGSLHRKLAPQPMVSINPGCSIALFPKELERDPTALDQVCSSHIIHDVPYDDPPVIAAYLRRLSQVHPGSVETIVRSFARDRTARPQLSVVA
jgi:predicted ATP-grasp superfamily ATP-dependent carboligase